MHKRYILPNIILILTAFTNLKCSKSFLDNPSQTVLLRQEYVKDLQSSQAYLNGIYIQLSDVYSYAQIAYPEVTSDNLKPINGLQAMLDMYYWNQQPSEEDADLLYSNILHFGSTNANGVAITNYGLISSCNFIVNTIDKFRNEDNQKADVIKGQALLIRSLAYFQLVNIFAQPFNFTPQGSHPGIAYITSHDWTEKVNGRNSVSQVYDAIIKDMEFASQLLPATAPNNLQPTKTTAEALLARLYLYKDDYESAKIHAAEALKHANLMNISQGYPDNIFQPIPPSQTETLFQLVPANLIVNPGNFSGYYLGDFLSGASQTYTATKDITDILKNKPNDIRSKWITTSGDMNNITKFPLGSHYYQCIIRSSEVYLTLAECYSNLNMEDSAKKYLYEIQKRADLTALPSTASGAQLLNEIKNERRKELSFEGFRLFDLLRWKESIHRSDPLTPDAATLTYPSNKVIAPIPLMDVKLYGFSQNPGY